MTEPTIDELDEAGDDAALSKILDDLIENGDTDNAQEQPTETGSDRGKTEEEALVDKPDVETQPEVDIKDEKPETQPQQPKPQKTVPYNALKEERDKRKAANSKIEDLQQLNAEYHDKLNRLADAYEQGKQVSTNQTEFDNDPIESLRKQQDLLSQQQEDFKAQQYQTTVEKTQFDHQTQLVQQIRTHAYAQAEEHAKENADLIPALNHLMAVKTQQYQLSNPQASKFDIDQMINEETFNHMAVAVNTNQNFGEYIYQYAKIAGYAPNIINENTQSESHDLSADDQIIKKFQTLEKGVKSQGLSPQGKTTENLDIDGLQKKIEAGDPEAMALANKILGIS